MTVQAGQLVQTPPVMDNVEDSQSDTYTRQLTCVGAVPPITWTTVLGSTGFLVSPQGIVGTSALLEDGAYTATGTMVDAASNSGTWIFTLNVVPKPAPQTSVTPVSPLPFTGIEIMVPFQIDPATGMVATVTDYRSILEQHVLSALMTSPGERVMLPTYGAGMELTVFEPISDLTAATIQDRIETTLAQWETSITLVSVDVAADLHQPYVLNVSVTFTAIPYVGAQTINISIGGGLPAIPTTEIGPFL